MGMVERRATSAVTVGLSLIFYLKCQSEDRCLLYFGRWVLSCCRYSADGRLNSVVLLVGLSISVNGYGEHDRGMQMVACPEHRHGKFDNG